MLKGLSSQDQINKSLIQNNELDKVSAGKKNPYSNIDKNLLIDETSISNEAMNLYQKDVDIRKFSSLVLSDPDNLGHNTLVAQNVFGAQDSGFESKVIEGIFNNKTFLRDLFG